MRLNPRLQIILQKCQPGLPLWDLCCDHGYLGIAAQFTGTFTQVTCNDSAPHLIARLPKDIRALLGPAEEIPEDLTGNVVIAGVGGEKTYKILSSHARRGSLKAERLVLCPEKDADWLAEQEIPGYALTEKTRITHNQGYRWVFLYSVCKKAAQS